MFGTHYLRPIVTIQCLSLILCYSVESTNIINSQNGQNVREIDKPLGIMATIEAGIKPGILAMKNYYGRNTTVNPHLLSPKCYEDILYMRDLFEVNHTSYSPTPFWQKHMMDSYGKLPAGLLEGNVFWMGEFGQCTKVKVWKHRRTADSTRKPHFQGKYCLLNINRLLDTLTTDIVNPMPIFATTSVCIPSSCTALEVETVVNEFMYPLRAVIEERECLTGDPHPVSKWTIFALMPFAILAVMVLIATIWEVMPIMLRPVTDGNKPQTTVSVNKSHRTLKSVVLSFSGYTNTKKLLNTSHRNEILSSVNGLRAMSMMMVIAGHMIAMTIIMSNGRHNPAAIFELMKKWWAQILFYGPYTVDTFFCLTGFLVAYVVMETARKMGRFNVLVFYAHRMWRLTPTYILLTLFVTGPYQLTFTGPLWIASIFFNETTCRQNLWKTPLYIDIYTMDAKSPMCMPHTWYLNTEMGLYILSGLILYPMIKKHWTVPFLGIAALIASLITIATLGHLHNLQNIASFQSSTTSVMNYFKEIYIKPWGRAPPFIIGMMVAYVFNTKGKNLTINKGLVATSWTLTAVGLLGCLFINYPYAADFALIPSHLRYISNMTFGPLVWAACIGWILISCSSGYGGIVDSMLSWKFLVPIGRLSFCAYIVHFEVLAQFGSSRKQALYADVYIMIYLAIALNVVTIIVAWIFHLLVEAPTIQFETILLRTAGKKYQKTGTTQSNGSSKYIRIPMEENNLSTNNKTCEGTSQTQKI